MFRQNSPVIVPAPNLHGQRPRAVLSGETAYVVRLPQLVAEPRVVQVTPCPDSSRVLIAREVYDDTLAPGAAREVARELQLLLYSPQRRRTSVVFRYTPTPGEVPRLGKFFWWVGGERASFSLHISSADRTQRLLLPLLLQVSEEKVTPFKLDLPRNASGFHLPSPTRPFALFVQVQSKAEPGRVFRVQPDGSTTLLRNDDLITRFLADGESALIRVPSEGGETYKRVHLLTGKETPLTGAEAAQLQAKEVDQAERDQSLAATLPLQLIQRHSPGEPRLPLLYLAPQPLVPGEETLLLADAEPAGLTRDLRSAFYFQQGQLYQVALEPLPRKAFLEGRDRDLQELTLRRALQLHVSAFQDYLNSHNQSWPPPGTSLSELFPQGQSDLGLTQNPLTGRDDLRFEYRGSEDPNGAKTRVASLGGPRGRAVLYGDGRVVWEPER